MPKRRRIEIRVNEVVYEELHRAAVRKGHRSVNRLVRETVEADVRGGASALHRTEEIVAASLERLRKDLRSLHTNQQALFALTDSLTRLILTCVPEPPADVLDQAKRRAKLRYERFLLSTAQHMAGEGRATLEGLVDRAQQ
jgi:hypothetical protein